YADWENDGHVRMWGKVQDGQHEHFVDGNELRLDLFAWHPYSGYGMLIELRAREGHPALRLSAAQAIDYLSDPKPIQHREFHWDSSARELMAVARRIRGALATGAFIPMPPAGDPSGSPNSVRWRLMDA